MKTDVPAIYPLKSKHKKPEHVKQPQEGGAERDCGKADCTETRRPN